MKIDILLKPVVLFFQEHCIVQVAGIPHQPCQLSQRETELMRQHNRFRLRIIGYIQRIIPVRKINLYQSMLSLIQKQSVYRCLYMLQHRGFSSVLPGNLFFQCCKVSGLFDQLTHRPDDPEGLVRIAGIIIGIPGQHPMPVLKLVTETFQDLLCCFILSVA